MALSRDNLDQTLPATRTIAEPVRYVEKPTNPRFKDLEGQRFGRLIVLGYLGKRGFHKHWLCQCDCGAERAVQGPHLLSGHTTSCGCSRGEKNVKHGHARLGNTSNEYSIYSMAKDRCENPKSKMFSRYGGRGIAFLFRDFDHFIGSLGTRPSSRYTLERLDNDGPYSDENCKWATRGEQARNRSDNIYIAAFGKSQILTDWARERGLSRRTIQGRLKRGWCTECAVSLTPSYGYKNACPHKTVTPG